MTRRSVSILAVLICASVVYAGANKIRGFTPVGGENPEADGFAILNYAAGENKTIVQIILSDFTPNTTYDIEIADFPGAFIQDELVTDDKGKATLNTQFPTDFSGSDLNLVLNGGEVTEELRAVGFNPN